MPYLRVTCPEPGADRRREIAAVLVEEVVDLFTPRRGPGREVVRARTTVHFIPYREAELFVAGQESDRTRPDITVELSDWFLGVRRQRIIAARLTPVLVQLFEAEPDAVNIRFHSYPPTDFAVAGKLLSDRIPIAGQLAKRLFG